MIAQPVLIQSVIVLGVLAIAYLLLVRPQLRRLSSHRRFLTTLKPGDWVVTDGGLIGHLTKIGEGRTVQLELSEGVHVEILLDSIASLFAR
jgi:preprotein translocase subunit YajC